MRASRTGAGWALMALALAGCGGGGGGAGGIATPAPQARLEWVAVSEAPLPSGSLQTRLLELRNTGAAAARELRLNVKLDAAALQLPLACEGAAAQSCQVSTEGNAISIAELPAGGVIQIRQQLRVKTGTSGAVLNEWSYSGSGLAASSWQHKLQAYSADLSVAVRPTSAASEAELSYEVTLSNAGPDEARDVKWQQVPAPGMAWVAAACSASGGAVCPSKLSEHMALERVPVLGSLKLSLRYQVPKPRYPYSDRPIGHLSSEIQAAGDPFANNDRVTAWQDPRYVMRDGNLFAVDMEGNQYRLGLSMFAEKAVHLSGPSFDRSYYMDVTVTGAFLLRTGEALESPLALAESFLYSPSLMVGSTQLMRGRQWFIASQDLVTSVEELEGIEFAMLGSRADRWGKPLDSFVRMAKFQNGRLDICEGDDATPIAKCPSQQLQRYQASIVGHEMELASAQGSFRLMVARTRSGPVLIQSQRDASDGSSRFGIGVPTGQYFYGADYNLGGMQASTFGNSQGLAEPTLVGFSYVYPDKLALNQGTPSISFFLSVNGGNSLCTPKGELALASAAGLYAGVIEARDEQGKACYSGPVYFIGSRDLAVVLGAKGGPLMGRWLITTQ